MGHLWPNPTNRSQRTASLSLVTSAAEIHPQVTLIFTTHSLNGRLRDSAPSFSLLRRFVRTPVDEDCGDKWMAVVDSLSTENWRGCVQTQVEIHIDNQHQPYHPLHLLINEAEMVAARGDERLDIGYGMRHRHTGSALGLKHAVCLRGGVQKTHGVVWGRSGWRRLCQGEGERISNLRHHHYSHFQNAPRTPITRALSVLDSPAAVWGTSDSHDRCADGGMSMLINGFSACSLDFPVVIDETMYQMHASAASHSPLPSSSLGHGHGHGMATKPKERRWGDRPVLLLGSRLGVDGVNLVDYEVIKSIHLLSVREYRMWEAPWSLYYFRAYKATTAEDARRAQTQPRTRSGSTSPGMAEIGVAGTWAQLCPRWVYEPTRELCERARSLAQSGLRDERGWTSAGRLGLRRQEPMGCGQLLRV
ncbi:hypothetical protein R3P38DRAFT_2770156 [Favolaschia claudopus]|uniref:Uncharacterized protein n=1 Tax=Favolaschia claudopus TaxID=2862362 RepID=A0AAW0CP78_9AGAR